MEQTEWYVLIRLTWTEQTEWDVLIQINSDVKDNFYEKKFLTFRQIDMSTSQ